MRKDRICLRCEGIFSSPGNHIRKCGTCLKNDQRNEINFQNWNHNLNYDRTFIPIRNRKGTRTGTRENEEIFDKFWGKR